MTDVVFKNNGKPPFTPEKTYPRNRVTPKRTLLTPVRKLNVPETSWWQNKNMAEHRSPGDDDHGQPGDKASCDQESDSTSGIWGGLVSVWKNLASGNDGMSRPSLTARKRSRCMDPLEGTAYELLDVSSSDIGGKILLSTDDFYGHASNILKPDDATPLNSNDASHGWCTRRRREVGHDWCIIKLAAPTYIRRVELSTAGYIANHAPKISVEYTSSVRQGEVEGWLISCLGTETDFHTQNKGRGLYTDRGTEFIDELEKALRSDEIWHDLIDAKKLNPGHESSHQHVFHIKGLAKAVQYLRLNLFPDGGISRFKVFGEVARPAAPLSSGSNYCSLLHGAAIIDFSSAYFGSPWNLLRPEESLVPESAWVTGRNRNRPDVIRKNGDHLDWGDIINDTSTSEYVVIQLAHRALVDIVVVSTKSLCGNIPDVVIVEVADVAKIINESATLREQRMVLSRSESAVTWTSVSGPLPLQPDQDLTYRLMVPVEATHLRVRSVPDGAISRIRLYGKSCIKNGTKRKKIEDN